MPHSVSRRLVAGLLLAAGPLGAHTVPTLTVEAEFSSRREAVFRVNLDPRLFLSAQPTTLPPVPASWWMDQDAAARSKTTAEAGRFLKRILRFDVGGAPIDASWQVTAIDSASAFPLTVNSSETHLLAEHRGPLPAVAGDFKVTLAADSPVGMILLNSLEGKPERHPQALFPGESSRAFKLPEPAKPPSAAPTATAPRLPALSGWLASVARFWRPGARHFAGDHLLVSLLLAVVLGGRWLRGAGMIAVFHAAHAAAALAVVSGWLPEAFPWMQVAGWAALAAGLFGAQQDRPAAAMICFASSGLAHGLNVPHLHLASPELPEILRDAGLLLTLQLVMLVVGCAVITRCRHGRRAGLQCC